MTGAETRSLTLAADFRGRPLAAPAIITVGITLGQGQLSVEVDAPWWDDPAPGAPAGRTPKLWEHSVVELFLMGPGGRYVELELGPHGHYLLLELRAFRVLVQGELRCEYSVARLGERWRGLAHVAASALPPRPWRMSACAIWGEAGSRTYAMAHPTGGDVPNFHQQAAFGAPW